MYITCWHVLRQTHGTWILSPIPRSKLFQFQTIDFSVSTVFTYMFATATPWNCENPAWTSAGSWSQRWFVKKTRLYRSGPCQSCDDPEMGTTGLDLTIRLISDYWCFLLKKTWAHILSPLNSSFYLYIAYMWYVYIYIYLFILCACLPGTIVGLHAMVLEKDLNEDDLHVQQRKNLAHACSGMVEWFLWETLLTSKASKRSNN